MPTCPPVPPPPPIPASTWWLTTSGVVGAGDCEAANDPVTPFHFPGFACVASSYPPDIYLAIPAVTETGGAEQQGSLNPVLPAGTATGYATLLDCLEAWRDAMYGPWWACEYQPHDEGHALTGPPYRKCVLTGNPTIHKGMVTWDVPDGETLVRRTVVDGPWYGGPLECVANLGPCDCPDSPSRTAGYTSPGYYLAASYCTPADSAVVYLSALPDADTLVYTTGYATEEECEAAGGMP